MKQTSDSLGDLLGQLVTGLNNAKPNNFQYKPHNKQIMFHASNRKGRLYIGGNRSGKTTGGINEDIYWLRGKHPYLKLPPAPIYGRIVTVDIKNGSDKIIIPQLRQWIPTSELVNGSWEDSFNANKQVLTLENGSQLEIMGHEQPIEKFAGVPRHFIHFDEECPKDIYKECVARLVDYNGRWWMTMTPVDGMTWTYDDLWNEGKGSENVDIIKVDIHENPHLGAEAVASLLSTYTEEEQQIRGAGDYIALSGLVFKFFNAEKHVVASGIPPRTWTHYMSLDHGFSNPTAVVWHAVSPEGQVVSYKEHYKSEWTVEQHAQHITQINKELKKNYGIDIFLQMADPAIKQRQAVTGHSIQIEYAQNGIMFALGAVRDVNAGLDKMNNYLRLGKWFITQDCPNLIREVRRYKRAQYSTSKTRENNNKKELPQKKDDHAIDSTRYFFSFQPNLDISMPTPEKFTLPNLLDTASSPMIIREPDVHFNMQLEQRPRHEAYDEFVGEF
jgi:phage terminase large subunit-like protein